MEVEISFFRNNAAAKIASFDRKGRQKSDGNVLYFLPEDAEKWDACVKGIEALKAKGDANITDEENEQLAVTANRRKEFFSAEGLEALFNAFGSSYEQERKDRIGETFSGKELDLATRLNPEKLLQEEEDRMTARIFFETSTEWFIKRCFDTFKLTSVTLPSDITYKEQQTKSLKDLFNIGIFGTEEKPKDVTTKLKWAPSLKNKELEELNNAFGDNRHLVKDADAFRFETREKHLRRWKEPKLYDGVTCKDGIFIWSNNERLVKNLKKAKEPYQYFYGFLKTYITKEGDSYKYGSKVVKIIDVYGLEKLVFDKYPNAFCLEENVKYFSSITFRVSPTYRNEASESKSVKIYYQKLNDTKYSYCVTRTDEEKKAWDETYLPWLKNSRTYRGTVVRDSKVCFGEKDTELMLQMYKNNPKGFVSCLAEKMQRGNTVDFSGLTNPKFDEYFKTKDDMQFLSCLKKANLWIPKICMVNFSNTELFKTDWNEKKGSGQTFILVSVLPQPSRIQFVQDYFETEDVSNGPNHWTGTRLVWNSYAKYLYNYAQELQRKKNDSMGWEIFADKIANAAKEQKHDKVCVDLNFKYFNYNETAVKELWMRGFDVLFDLSRNGRDEIVKLRKEGKTAKAMYRRDGDYNVWLLSGADLKNNEANRKIAEGKEKKLLEEKNELLKAIEDSKDGDIKISEDLLRRATVKEIFDAIEKNPNNGTVIFTWEGGHTLNDDLSAWARTYCSSKKADNRKLMKRIIKFIPEKEDTLRYFPGDDVAEYAMAGDEQGEFGCISDYDNKTLAFCTLKDLVAAKKEKMLSRIASDLDKASVINTSYERAATGFGYGFAPLIEAKMKPGRAGNFIFKINSRAKSILAQIVEYVSKPRNERSKDLVFTFDKGAEIRKAHFENWLNFREEELKARILYTFGKGDRKDEVTSITLKSWFTYLPETVRKSEKLALRKEDIVASSETTDSNFENLMKKVACNSLKILSVPKEVWDNKLEKTFLKGLSPLFDEKIFFNSTVVTVTSDSTDVIDALLGQYGDQKEARFCIKPDDDDTGKICLILSHKEFEDRQKKKLIDEIGKNTNDDKSFEFSTTNGTYGTLNGLLQLLNKEGIKGNLEVTGFDKGAAKAITEGILDAGVNRSWYMVSKNCEGFSLENLIGEMGDEYGWALDYTPGENEATVRFFPKKAKDDVSKEILKISEALFEKNSGKCTVCPEYWKIDAAAVLRAAENPKSKVTEVVFDGVRDKTFDNLLSKIATFCKDKGVANRRTNWKLMINFGTGKENDRARADLRNYRI